MKIIHNVLYYISKSTLKQGQLLGSQPTSELPQQIKLLCFILLNEIVHKFDEEWIILLNILFLNVSYSVFRWLQYFVQSALSFECLIDRAEYGLIFIH